MLRFSLFPFRSPLSAAILITSATAASGAVVITAEPMGGGIVFSGGGTLDLSDLSSGGRVDGFALVRADLPELVFGIGSYEFYVGAITPPIALGTGTMSFTPMEFLDDNFGVITGPASSLLVVPEGYTSGDSLTGSMTLESTDLATVGLTPGTYSWTWGDGATADSFTVIIVPEPSVSLLLGLGMGAFLIRSRERSGNGLFA